MLFSFLATLTPVLSTLLTLGLAIFVLSLNWRARPNRWQASGKQPSGRDGISAHVKRRVYDMLVHGWLLRVWL